MAAECLLDPMFYVYLPNLVVMPATLAANCGVSSKECYRSYRIEPPPSMYDLVQEMGRFDCVGDFPEGASVCAIVCQFIYSCDVRFKRS